jgi:hypothetical protein
MTPPYHEKQHDDAEKQKTMSNDEGSRGVENIIKSPEEKALVWKIDLYLMPSIWFLYLLAVSRFQDEPYRE